MKATIIGLNYQRGLYIFERNDGQIGYFELLGSPDLEMEDVLLGDFRCLGSETVVRKGTDETVDIFIEDFCSFQIAKEMIR